MPVVRAIRTLINRFPTLKPKFVKIMREEFDKAYGLNYQKDGMKATVP